MSNDVPAVEGVPAASTVLSRIRESAPRLQPLQYQDEMETFGITFAAHIAQWFTPHSADLGYYDDLIVVATPTGTGAAFCPHRDASRDMENLLGQDCRLMTAEHLCMQVAALDAAYGSINPSVVATLALEGTGSSARRGDLRASLIANEVDRIGAESVVMVGAVGSVLQELSTRGMRVVAVDMDPAVVGQRLGGVHVSDARDGPTFVERSDAAVITGMALTTETLDDLLEVAVRSQTSVIMFCQTGSNFAPELLRAGVSAVVTERFPFYMLPGSTRFHVFRNVYKKGQHANNLSR